MKKTLYNEDSAFILDHDCNKTLQILQINILKMTNYMI